MKASRLRALAIATPVWIEAFRRLAGPGTRVTRRTSGTRWLLPPKRRRNYVVRCWSSRRLPINHIHRTDTPSGRTMTDIVPMPVVLLGHPARAGSVVAETQPRLGVPAALLYGHSVQGCTHRRARQREPRPLLGPFEGTPTDRPASRHFRGCPASGTPIRAGHRQSVRRPGRFQRETPMSRQEGICAWLSPVCCAHHGVRLCSW
jgi:hypothetical protein